MSQTLYSVLLVFFVIVTLVFILVILVQRGRGGGLVGAFGGPGGSSAFGTKTGDVFTIITVFMAVLFLVLACLLAFRPQSPSSADETTPVPVQSSSQQPSEDDLPTLPQTTEEP